MTHESIFVMLLLGLNAITDTNIYYHNNLQNSEFMDMFGRLTGMKATAMSLDYFTDLLEIKHI